MLLHEYTTSTSYLLFPTDIFGKLISSCFNYRKKKQWQTCILLKMIYISFNYMYMFLSVCWSVHVSADACEGQKRVSDVLEL